MITSETIHVTPVSSAYLAQRITVHGPLNVLVVLGLSQVWPYLGRVIMVVCSLHMVTLSIAEVDLELQTELKGLRQQLRGN